MLTDADIFDRYQVKQAEFEKNAQVTLLGHSLFDMWLDILPSDSAFLLKGKTVANVGISGVSARQYLDVIIKAKLLKNIGDTVFIFLGVNDIVKEPNYSPKQVVEWLEEIVQDLKSIKPSAKIYLLEATPINNRPLINNQQIIELNDYFKSHPIKDVEFIETWQEFINEEGNLATELAIDGLHFSPKGFDKLTQILEKYL